MEPQIIVRDYGICRCCAAKGNHRDINKEYYVNGIREMFYDIFVECFNLYLSKNRDLSTLICSSCVTRLREASTFRMTVLSTEKQLLAAVPDYDGEVDSSERLKEDNSETNDPIENGNEFDSQYNSNDIEEEYMNVVEGERELMARFNLKTLKLLPTRRTLVGYCPVFAKYLESVKDEIITPRAIEKLMTNPNPRPKIPSNKTYITEKLANAINASTVFEFSNATAFKTKHKSGFPCFYCRQIFDDMNVLREHQRVHPKSSLYKLFCKYTADALVVYADITDLKCTICDKGLDTLKELKKHLSKIHSKRIFDDFEDRVIPFKLSGDSDFECQICRFSFETFGAIEKHMNVHFRNSICEICGAGFVTMHRLKIHHQAVHNQKNFPCNICKKVFNSSNKYKIHFDTVHQLQKKYKCPKCLESFIDYFTRRKHLVEKHGVTPIVYRCKVCDRAFSRRFSQTIHMKRCHLVQKDYQCEFCQYSCFTKSELRVHMLKHTGEKAYECAVCNKAFGRHKNLKEHMQIHDDNRFACDVCGQRFVQDCSLKGHIKAHHPEIADT